MEDISLDERMALETMLQTKLSGIPKDHIPDITADDIIEQRTFRTHLPHIPSDIQLPYLLTNRRRIAAFDDMPTKSYDEQDLRMTRAIFFYRLDVGHQFQRHHDRVRWNIAIFLALLRHARGPHTNMAVPLTNADQLRIPKAETLPPPSRPGPLSEEQEEFMWAYLKAVVEQHDTPSLFTAREHFIQIWKTSPFDLFSFRATQGKQAKKRMAGMTAEWDSVFTACGGWWEKEDYETRITPLIGSILPGKSNEKNYKGTWASVEEAAKLESVGEEGKVEMKSGEGGGEENELLKALRVPMGEKIEVTAGVGEKQGKPLMDINAAINVLKSTSAREILEMLLEVY